MNFKAMSFTLVSKTLCLILAAFCLGLSLGLGLGLGQANYAATNILLSLICLGIGASLLFDIKRSNHELERFLSSLSHNDLSQHFNLSKLGLDYDQLGQRLKHIMESVRSDRKNIEARMNQLQALVEHVPVPIISIHNDGSLTLWNNPARRLFQSSKLTRLSDFEKFGQVFYQALVNISPGKELMVNAEIDGESLQLKLAASELAIRGSVEKLISLQNIVNELEGMQLQAWQDLVRVLTHEIMNSITPISSLAQTTEQLVSEISLAQQDQSQLAQDPRLLDISEGVKILGKRAAALMEFVTNYRQLTRLPKAQLAQIDLASHLGAIVTLMAEEIKNAKVAIEINIEPANLNIYADPKMLDQVAINLIQNGLQALSTPSLSVQSVPASEDTGRITISAHYTNSGQVQVDFIDNGPGIDESLVEQIFLPFFTTKNSGSGIGLALCRQMMASQHGTIRYLKSGFTGGHFRLLF